MKFNATIMTTNGPKIIPLGSGSYYKIINPLDDYIECLRGYRNFATLKNWKVPRYHTIIVPEKFCRNKNTESFLMKEYFKYPDDRFVQYEDKDFPMLFNLGMLQVLPKFYEDFKPIMIYTS